MEDASRKRAAARGWLTRMATNVATILEKTDSSDAELADALVQFESRLQVLDEAQAAVEAVIVLEQLDADIVSAAEFREQKRVPYIKAREKLSATVDKDNGEADAHSVGSASRGSVFLRQAKLPKLELPKFSGDHTEWQAFWDKFEAVVDQSDLPAVNKFTYLQSLLRGDAAAAIRGLTLTADNYKTAKEILQKRFGRRERIIFSHIQQLLNLGSGTAGKTTEGLWALHDKLQTHVRSLETLGITGGTYGVILTPLILHHLPNDVRMEWARTGEGKEGDLEALLTFLHGEILRRERSSTFTEPSTSAKAGPTTNRTQARTAPTASALLTSREGSQETSTVPAACPFCQGRHSSESCSNMKALDVDTRWGRFKELGLCFLCGKNHLARQCKMKYKCLNCNGRHHRLLCKKDADETIVKAQTHSTQVRDTPGNTLLQTASVIVDNGQKQMKANVFFDAGSDKSYISAQFAEKLGAKTVGKERVSIASFGARKPSSPQIMKCRQVDVVCADGERVELVVTEIPVICSPICKPKLSSEFLDKIGGLQLVEDTLTDSDGHVHIDILIGLDYYWKLVKPSAKHIGEGLIAQETKFGWMVSGSWGEKGYRQNMISHQFLCLNDLPESTFHKFWDLETIGISHEKEQENQDKILVDFNNSITKVDGRYEVQLPWKEGKKDALVTNESHARTRLVNLNKRLEKNPELQVGYTEALSEMEKRGIIHEVPEKEKVGENPIFYLPHHPVVRESSSTTKIRPVFDASTKGVNGISLNDCLETGPNLIPNLVEVLLRFRRWRYGLTADITKAFLQIKVAKQDQDVHRFLWDVNNQTRVMRFDRVVFGNVSSPFLLNATVKFHLGHFEESRMVSELRDNLYVDDWLSGADSEQEIKHMISRADEIMSQGAFPLAKWGSNSRSVHEVVSKDFGNNTAESEPSVKILGIYWDTEEDSLSFKTMNVYEGLIYTKRLVLSLIARIFDPQGFLSPFVISIKILFQEIWRMGYDWDDPLAPEIQDMMSNWAMGVKDIREFRIPRCLTNQGWGNTKNMKLVVFSDASEKAYGCCIYLQVSNEISNSVSLIMSKTRVAPLKRVTLPRLELLGALLAARLVTFVKTSLKLPEDTAYTCYTDSSIVLGWIRGDPFKWKQFVANRVSEIQSLTSPSNWKHCRSKQNPADLLTRGVSAKELINSSLWTQGPDFLSQSDSDAQPEEQDENLDGGIEGELFAEMRGGGTVLTSVTNSPFPLIDYSRYSRFSKMVRVIGWILRFVSKLKTPRGSQKLDRELSSEETENARFCLFKSLQNEHYGEEIGDLKQGKSVNKGSSVSKLGPCLGKDGLLRVRGRLQFSSLLYDEKHPVILPKCHATLLLVRSQHELMKHAGVNTLITTLRSKYWIVGLRTIAKRVCKECIFCQKQDARACDQITSPLPEDRVKRSPPFSVVGVDHAGPVYCCDTGTKKHYILLFTCAVVRCVHLELVDSLSLDDFLLAFRRFVARRGLPSVIYSDNAKTFKGANAALLKQYDHAVPTWKFIAPLSPWWGGFYERMVRSIKGGLRKSLDRNSVSRSELETTLHEVEACINSRPLTYVEETSDPLTPSHFLIGRSSPFLSTGVSEHVQSPVDFPLRNEVQQDCLEHFWSVWSEEYIRNLPPVGRGSNKRDLKVGNVVLIKEEGKARLQWPMGVVTKLFPGKDGLTRCVEVKTSKGLLMRAVQRLYKLEILGNCENLLDEIQTPLKPDSQPRDSSVDI